MVVPVRIGKGRGGGRGAAYLATACALRNAPVVLISSVLLHSGALMSMACVQPTTPAKQHSMSTLPSSRATSSTADFSWSALVMSTFTERICALGKSFFRESISLEEELESRSNSARFERPCSSRARALTRARVPAPPVTASPVISCRSVGRYESQEMSKFVIGACKI